MTSPVALSHAAPSGRRGSGVRRAARSFESVCTQGVEQVVTWSVPVCLLSQQFAAAGCWRGKNAVVSAWSASAESAREDDIA